VQAVWTREGPLQRLYCDLSKQGDRVHLGDINGFLYWLFSAL
jgi:hypothetical protein